MAVKDCADLFRLLGYECHLVDAMLELTTPITLPGGAPVRAYFTFGQSHVEISDEGDLLFEAAGLGMLGFRKFEATFVDRIQQAGAEFHEGRVLVRASVNRLWEGYVTFVRAALAIADYIEERRLLERHEDDLVARIEEAVHKAAPEATVERDVTVEGYSGAAHRFPLLVNRTLVEPLRPSGRSTGPALRRIVDVTKAGRNVAAVMDDLSHPEAAERETRIVSAVVKVYKLSNIEAGRGVLDLAA